MYGISNSQQQGGGGGGAASYKAIKSTIAPNNWQEVAKQPYFVGENAVEWTVDDDLGLPAKISSDNIGTIAGQEYTITIEANGVEYSSTATAQSGGGILMLQFQFPEAAAAAIMMYDYFDWATQTPGTGSFCAVETTANSLVITNFSGEGFGTTIQATISDSAIKVNSAVTMYTNTSEKITVGEKTNGSVTLIAPSIPETDIHYSLEIVGTDTEGLFELVNGYIPDITPPTVPQWHTIYEDTTGTGVTSIDLTAPLKGGDLYRITIDGEFYIFCPVKDGYNAIQDIGIVHEVLHGGNSSLDHTIMNFMHSENHLSLASVAHYDITEAGISDYVFSTAPGITFTKLEVYR